MLCITFVGNSVLSFTTSELNFIKIVQAIKKLNSISRSRARMNFRRRPILSATLYRNLMKASNFGGTFDQLLLRIFLRNVHRICLVIYSIPWCKKFKNDHILKACLNFLSMRSCWFTTLIFTGDVSPPAAKAIHSKKYNSVFQSKNVLNSISAFCQVKKKRLHFVWYFKGFLYVIK